LSITGGDDGFGSIGYVENTLLTIDGVFPLQQDPRDEDFPYCTIKLFPSTLEHCIQWARDKVQQLSSINCSF
jgi:ubiquitin-activating enzyme E1-like protein 2